jgi:hypothetical protein
MVEDNPKLTMEEAALIYYDTKEYEKATSMIQYQRCNSVFKKEAIPCWPRSSIKI